MNPDRLVECILSGEYSMWRMYRYGNCVSIKL